MIWGKKADDGEPAKAPPNVDRVEPTDSSDAPPTAPSTAAPPVAAPPAPPIPAAGPALVPTTWFRPDPTGPSPTAPISAGGVGYRPGGYLPPERYPAFVPYTPGWSAPAQPRHSAGRWLLAVFCVVVAVVVSGAAGLVGVASYSGLLDREGRWTGTVEESATGAPARPEAQTPPPPANAPASEWQAWVNSRAFDILANRTRALTANKENEFVANVDPTVKSLVSEQRRRFRGLRDLGVVNFRERLVSTPKAKGRIAWTADFEIEYCVVDPNCLGTPKLRTTSTWTLRGGRLVLSAIATSDDEWNGPRPWEVNDLVVRKGSRVVVATTKAHSSRLDNAVRAADRAAKVADTFAGFTVKAPARYTIYLAGPGEWKKWYGGTGENWAAARAWPVSEYHTDVVIRIDSVRASEMENLLRHELTHVTSLAGADLDGDSKEWWWLLEGIAEYASYRGRSVSTYDALSATRRFVNSGDNWDGHVNVKPPGESASLEDAAARYGIAFLCVRRISDKYGETKMLKFFNGVLQQNRKLDASAKEALGTSWSTVDNDCASYIRAAVD